MTYSFGVAGTSVYSDSYATSDPQSAWDLSDAAKDAIRQALNAWSTVAGITCVEVPDTGTSCGDIRFSGSDLPATAYTFMPVDTLPEGGDVWFGDYFADPSLTWAPGSYEFLTALHEIGHALGLKHPHEAENGMPAAPPAVDSQLYSVMSYRSTAGAPVDQGYSQDRFATTPMMDDVQAIQYLYGANMATNAGDTVYSWQPGAAIFDVIWDGGGYDTIDWSNQTSGAYIDLQPGSYSDLGPAWRGNYLLQPETLGIADNCWIEAATGGAGNDTLIGNALDNTLVGEAGDDLIAGGDGNDGLNGGDDSDTLLGGTGQDILAGGDGNDALLGGDGDDVLFGGNGDDTMTGEAGNDTLVGGDGNDTLFDSTGNDLMFGGNGDDALSGGAGNDVLSGDDGNDTLFGGDGDDTLFGGTGNDLMFGGADADVLVADGGNDVLLGDDGNDTLFGGDGNDALFGGAGNDLLIGGDGNDAIFLDGGADVAWGGNGADLFELGAVSGGAVVADFTPGVDHLALFDTTLNRSRVIASAQAVNGNTVIDLRPGSSVVILGRTGNTSSWFV